MKTKTVYLLCATILAASFYACTNLKGDSYGLVVSEKFNPQTEEEISYLVNAAYVPWRETMLLWNGVVRAQELSADQDVLPARGNGWVDGGIYKRWHQHKWTTDDDSALQSWTRTYGGINTCNRLLSQINDGIINLTGDTKDNLVSELKVLRASYYYILVDLYGNVPIVTDFKDMSLPKQSTRQEVFDFIIAEITSNIGNLSQTPRGYYYGRINQWGAYALLSKMYLNAQVWTGTAKWQACIDACDEIIKYADRTGEYALETNQKDVFVTKNENSKEIIFALPFDEIYVKDWNAFDFHLYSLASENQLTYNFTNVPWGGVCVTPQFIESYDVDDARLKDSFISGQQYKASGEILNRSDNGKPFIYVRDVPSIDKSDVVDGYRWGKFEYAIGIANRLSNDWPVLRYADVLLMKAEALLRSDRGGAGALVTRVRERAFKSNPAKAVVTDAQLKAGSVYNYGRRDENKTTHEGGSDIEYGRLLDELGWEFTQEGRRRQDMIRFGIFDTKSWFSHDATKDNSRNLYPIPNSVLLTNSNLKQNPGYSK